MKIGIASDHRGVQVKSRVHDLLTRMGYDVVDFGTDDANDSVDYPDYAAKVAREVSQGSLDRGILICGTGIGMCITANKFPGVRAADCHDDLTAEMSRRHNNANVMCLSADLLSDNVVNRMVEIWVRTEFEGGRHARRVEKIQQLETENRSH